VIGTSGVGVSKAVGNQVASVQVVLWMDGEGAGGAGGADLGGHAVERLGRVVHGWCTAGPLIVDVPPGQRTFEHSSCIGLNPIRVGSLGLHLNLGPS